jgi:hypothetical protein
MIRRIIIAAMMAALTARADMEWETAVGQLDQVTSGLTHYWTMRNSGGAAIDEKAVHNLASVGTAPTFGTTYGAVNTGVRFGGAGYLNKNVSGFRASDTTGTISAWVRSAAMTTGTIHILGSGRTSETGRYFLLGIGSGKVGVYSRDGTTAIVIDTAAVLSNDVWYHIVMTSDGSTLRCYIDGQLTALNNTTGTNTGQWFSYVALRDNVTIGALVRSSTAYTTANTDVDEVRYYNRALSADEIKQLYRMGALPKGIK